MYELNREIYKATEREREREREKESEREREGLWEPSMVGVHGLCLSHANGDTLSDTQS